MKQFVTGLVCSSVFSMLALGVFFGGRASAYFGDNECKGRGGSSPPTCTGLPDPCDSGSCKRDGNTNNCKCLVAGGGEA
jgi:hypothetical protein